MIILYTDKEQKAVQSNFEALFNGAKVIGQSLKEPQEFTFGKRNMSSPKPSPEFVSLELKVLDAKKAWLKVPVFDILQLQGDIKVTTESSTMHRAQCCKPSAQEATR